MRGRYYEVGRYSRILFRKKGVTEERPFGPETLVFKVMGKVFAITAIDSHPLSMNLKCDPEDALAFRDIFPAIKPGFHMNKKHLEYGHNRRNNTR